MSPAHARELAAAARHLADLLDAASGAEPTSVRRDLAGARPREHLVAEPNRPEGS